MPNVKTFPTVLLTILALAGCTVSLPSSVTVPPAAIAPATVGQSPAQPMSATPNAAKVVSAVRLVPENAVVTQGTARDMTASVTYTDGSFDGSVSWTSSDETILTVNPTTGRVSANKPGIATVIAAAIIDPSRRSQATITVRSPEITEAFANVDPKEASLKFSATVRLNARIRLSDGTESPNVQWISDNTAVATVTNGLVTAVGPGTTTITAIATGDSTKKASAKITVTP